MYRIDPEKGCTNREHRIQANEGKIVGARFATDKQLILVSNRGTVISVDCDSGQTAWTTALHSFTFKEVDPESSEAQVVTSPTGRCLAIADDARVQLSTLPAECLWPIRWSLSASLRRADLLQSHRLPPPDRPRDSRSPTPAL